MYLSKKGIRSVQWGLRQSPQKLESFRELCVKNNYLTVCKVIDGPSVGQIFGTRTPSTL